MINPNYIPDNLSREDLELQKKQIKKSRSDYKKGIYTPRKKIKSFKSKKSGHIVDFQKRYSKIKSMNDLEAISKEFNGVFWLRSLSPEIDFPNLNKHAEKGKK